MVTYSSSAVLQVKENDKAGIHPGAILVLLAGALALAFCGFIYWRTIDYQNKTVALGPQIEQNKRELSNLDVIAKELTYFDSGATHLHQIFDNQIRWEDVLANIEKRLYKKMVITSLQITEQKNLQISGYTSNYNEYAKIYASLTSSTAQQYFTNVKPVTITKSAVRGAAGEVKGEQINFSFNITLTSEVYTKK